MNKVQFNCKFHDNTRVMKHGTLWFSEILLCFFFLPLNIIRSCLEAAGVVLKVCTLAIIFICRFFNVFSSSVLKMYVFIFTTKNIIFKC